MNSRNDNNLEQQAREKDLAFFGAITASVSHELNNVISIIDQTAGLLEDLLIGAQQGRPIPNARLQRIAENTRNQTHRGVRIIKRLNTFAHSVDDPLREFEINNLVENLTRLSQRFADLKKVQLENRFTDDPVTLISSPFLVQQALFLCIKWALNVSQPEDTIIIGIDTKDSTTFLTVDGRHVDFVPDDGEFVYLKLLMKRVNGEINIISDPDSIRFVLLIPSEVDSVQHDLYRAS